MNRSNFLRTGLIDVSARLISPFIMKDVLMRISGDEYNVLYKISYKG